MSRENAKAFALAQIAPYFKNPETCGFNPKTSSCNYLTPEGKMCVAGKNMINPENFPQTDGIAGILTYDTQEKVFREDVVGVLSKLEWTMLQRIHDRIATTNSGFFTNEDPLKEAIINLGLFTYTELKEAAEAL